MKRYFLFIVLTMCLFLNSTAQKNDQKTNTPKEEIKVNREYDKNGNLIKFDSLYSYSWSGDTTMLRSFSPKDFPDMFGDSLGPFSDSIFRSKSFFDNFDRMFAHPLNGTRDSILTRQFESFKDPDFLADSTVLNFNDLGDLFKENGKNKNDSISSKSHDNSLQLQAKSMEEMMQMLQSQIKEMEEYERKFFQKQSK